MSPRKETSYKAGKPPVLGDTSYGDAIGRQSSNRFVWLDCPLCGKQRWVRLNHNKPGTSRCPQCRQEGSKGSKTIDGYISVYVPRHSFFSAMSQKTERVLEHRLVMAKHLGRCLLPWEIIHHKNSIKDDNRIENLVLLPTRRFHVIDTELKRYVHKLEAQKRLMEKRINTLEGKIAAFEVEKLLEGVKLNAHQKSNRN